MINSIIRFPNLGLKFSNLPTGFKVFGIEIAFYGLIITLGIFAGYSIAQWMVKKTGQDTELYLDFALYAIIASVISARIYYVVFTFDEFKDDIIQVFNIRSGGLAIYGAIIGAVITLLIYTKVKKQSFWLMADTGSIGLITGQIIGRWGNFFNREAFGKYTSNLFAMQLNVNEVAYEFRAPITWLQPKFAGREKAFERIMTIRENMVDINGASYIQVHPTFLYESLWNLILLIILIIYTKHKKFDGEVMFLYLAGYGLGRVWIEGLRTDQLFLWNSPIAVSQLLSLILVIVSILVIIYKRYQLKKAK